MTGHACVVVYGVKVVLVFESATERVKENNLQLLSLNKQCL